MYGFPSFLKIVWLCYIFVKATSEEAVISDNEEETENKTRDEAVALIKKNDKKRAAYHNYYADTRWGSRSAYDLCLNSKIGIDIIVDMIVAAAKDMMK